MKTLFYLLMSASIVGCSVDSEKDFQHAYDLIQAEKADFQDLEKSLLQLEVDFPNNDIPKLKLGVLYLINAEPEKAQLYFDQIKNPEASFNEEDEAVYYAAMAQLAFLNDDLDSMEEYSSYAADCSEEAAIAMDVFSARTLYMRNKKEEAYNCFYVIWKVPAHREQLLFEDHQTFFNLAMELNHPAEALECLQYMQFNYGYRPGDSVTAALLFEHQGQLSESLLSLFIDIEAQLHAGLLTIEECCTEISYFAENSLEDESVQLMAQMLTRLVKAQPLDKHHEINVQLKNVFGYAYLKFVEKMNQKAIKRRDIVDMLTLEPLFYMHAGYYVAVWNAMKEFSAQYNLNKVKPILERIISLCPDTDNQFDARQELGRLMGLSVIQSKHLLIHSEIDAITAGYLRNADHTKLQPLINLLALENNSYTAYAAGKIQQLKQVGEIEDLLAAVYKNAKGDLKVRLENIINS